MARLKPSIPDMQVAFSKSVCLHPNEFNIGSTRNVVAVTKQYGNVFQSPLYRVKS